MLFARGVLRNSRAEIRVVTFLFRKFVREYCRQLRENDIARF